MDSYLYKQASHGTEFLLSWYINLQFRVLIFNAIGLIFFHNWATTYMMWGNIFKYKTTDWLIQIDLSDTKMFTDFIHIGFYTYNML